MNGYMIVIQLGSKSHSIEHHGQCQVIFLMGHEEFRKLNYRETCTNVTPKFICHIAFAVPCEINIGLMDVCKNSAFGDKCGFIHAEQIKIVT